MKMLVRLVAVACVLGGVAGAQDRFTGGAGEVPTAKRPMTFQDLQAMKRVSDPQISPSGNWVMFSVTDVSLEKNTKVNHLWVVPLAGGQEHQVTFSTGESNGRFSPDGKFVSFTGAPDETDSVSRIAIASWDEAKGTLGVARTLKAVSGDADGAIWSPDSRHFLFTTQVYPECSDKPNWTEEDACDKEKDEAAAKNPVKAQIWDHLLYRHWNAFTGEKRTHIILADFSMAGANPRDLTPRSAVGDAETPTFSLGGALGYAWAPDSKEMAYVTNLDKVPATSTNNDVFTLRVDEAGAVAKKVSTSPGSDDGPAYSENGKWLAWRSQATNGFESDKFDLVVMDRANGAIRNLTSKFDNWVDSFVWVGSGDIWFASPSQGHEVLASVELDDAKIFPMSRGGGEWTDFVPYMKHGPPRLVGVRMWVDRPPQLYSVDTVSLEHGVSETLTRTLQLSPGQRKPANASGTPLQLPPDQIELSHLNDSLVSQLALAPLEPFWFEGAGDTKVEGFIVKPPNFDASKKYPVKFLMHGGPQTAWGDAWSYRWNWELFAADGYVVIGVNRRGSTGYGQKFVDEVSGDWGGKAFVDLMKGLDYAETHYAYIDKDRECALGASYGGFMANWVLTHTDRFKCIVTHDGLYNAESAFGTTEELWFNEWEFRPLAANGEVEQTKPAYPWDYFDKPTAENPFRKNSPMLYIRNARTPTLIIHSQKDYRLDLSEGLQLFTALQLRGVPSKMLYFPDEGHWILKPRNSQLWYETVDDWCDRWLGMGKYKDAGPEKNPMAHPTAPHVGGSPK